ncbi:MAG TPA: LamG-like jellyroll fold domain-containing protein [Candidatus Kapabacteria bacterium]|nr:LamG-like jellyroll fold domain-containing protein [Candidatus Kapabacteria bacterium]
MRSIVLLLALCSSPLHAAEFVGAAEPAAPAVSPVDPSEQQKRFSLPPGFEIELVASEEQGIGKPITVAWDDAARLWTITALEYPLDGNEQPEAAKALYEKGGRDKVLVIENPYSATPQQPRVFADNLAMPMGVLPYKDGALVGHGPDVLFIRDTDGDGKADRREVILTGFGIQDSHLMPHQFTRAPGGWFYLAQGAFNYSRVKTKDGRELKFDQTRLARFTVDGLKFEDLTSGPCNIWGLVIGREGETFIQEANDYGYPVMAFHAGASYPGCSGAFKPYAPYFPSEVNFQMGGTGLSGLALSDPAGSFPGAYADVMYLANPITRKIQAIKIHRDGPWHRYEKLPDFVLSSDEWFRPVATHFGPDGCLYIVDWYNKIISHNEVPRTHPERDKTRGRIWRVRHKDQPRIRPANVLQAPEPQLLAHFRSQSTWEMRAALHQIVDRDLRNLAPELRTVLESTNQNAVHRIHALWTLEELGELTLAEINKVKFDSNRNLRREAIRALANVRGNSLEKVALLADHIRDGDPEVRAEVIRVARLQLSDPTTLQLLARMVQPILETPSGKNPHNGSSMKLREAYDRDFERYLIRAALEEKPEIARRFLASERGRQMSTEAQLLFSLALPPNESGDQVATLLRKIDRVPNDEELLRLAENLDSPEALETLKALLANPDARGVTSMALLKVRNRLDASKLTPLIEEPTLSLWKDGKFEIAATLAGAFKIQALAREMNLALSKPRQSTQIALLKALRELDASDSEALASLIRATKGGPVKTEALNSLASSKSAPASLLLEFWNDLNAVQRRTALRSLTSTQGNAKALVAAVQRGPLQDRDLDGESLDKLFAHFPQDPEVKALVERLSAEFRPVLRLDGKNESYIDSNITLEGPFTVETWIRLERGISNDDGILGVPGGADFNFAGGHFRVYCGQEIGDRVVARKPMPVNSWTHLAITRDSEGVFRLYQNGEIDITDDRKITNTFKDLDIGRTIPGGGTYGDLAEFRVWNRARTADEIRNDFDRTFEGEERPSGLVRYFGTHWKPLNGGARMAKVPDGPALLTAAKAREQQDNFARFRALADASGDLEKGRAVFASACQVCHSVNGEGGQIGPVLNGAGASGQEALLRAILTPNAAMEAGYRNYRVLLSDGETLDGFLVSEDENAIVLRQPNLQDQRIPREQVRRADYTQKSIMPEGLLDAMPPDNVRDLFAYLKSLK